MMKKTNLNLYILLIGLLFSFNGFAEISGHTVSGELDPKDSPYENSDSSEPSDNTSVPNIFGSVPQQYTEEELKGAQMSAKDKKWLESASEEDSILFKSHKNEYAEFTTEEILKDSYQATKSQIGFSYIYDTFDYYDNSGTFENTFNNSSAEADSVQAGYLFASYKHYFQRNYISTFFQGNVGVSFNSGKGSFNTGALSQTTFNLWIFPIDLNLGLKINPSRYFSLTLQGGPTIAPIWQNRDDREDGEDGKDIRQVGYGFNGSVSLDFSIYNIFPEFGLSLKKFSDVSDMSISLVARTMELSGFKREDFKVTGTSFGIGFNFEYL